MTDSDREISMYGCTVSEFMGEAEKSFFIMRPQYGGWSALVVSYLSDVQGLLCLNSPASNELARQILNRVKYIVANKLG